ELARFLPRHEQRNRYLRSGMRTREGEHAGAMFRTGSMLVNPGMELPPGASFDPDPQTSIPAELDALPPSSGPDSGSNSKQR
ncbi:MAG TPA: hypothetical protein VMA55_07435, partial [Acidovorax sp.]|nr:hypothetical protein [Acidovorax sp.]